MKTRREFMKNLCVAGAASSVWAHEINAQSVESPSLERAQHGESILRFDQTLPIVHTSSGPVRGYTRNAIHTFKGIRYGGLTSAKNRFLPPRQLEPEKEVFNAVAYSYACSQRVGDDWVNPVSHFVLDFMHRGMSEDCLNLNVWTRSVHNSKRPVLFYIHGGGFQTGSSFEMQSYDGENVVQRGDIVFVSIHHRLNVLGFLDLSTVGGDQFKSSANVGMLDLVAALKWVAENIANFGGDPSNVTLCGQSGGGGKVNALLRMPSAKGLFHKAIIQSGSFQTFREPKDSCRVGEGVVRKLGIVRGNLSTLQEAPYDSLYDAASGVIADLKKEAHDTGLMGRFGWAPTADGEIITLNGSEDFSAEIPLLVGYTRNEIYTSAFDPSLDSLSMEDATARLAKMYPERILNTLTSEYRGQYPDCTPAFLFSVLTSMMFADGAMSQVEQHAARSNVAPVYFYRFDWCPDIYDGRLGAFHSLDIGFTFDNTDRWESATGGSERARDLAARVSQAWINFASTGNPNHRDLPVWAPYTISSRATMIFDDLCRVLSSPDDPAHRIINQTS